MKASPPDLAPRDTSFAARALELYGADLHWFLLSRLRNDEDARDVAQEVYMRLLRLGTGELVRQPHAYVYFVANQVLAQFRLRAKQNPVTYDSKLAQHHDHHPTPDELQRDGVVDRLLPQSEIERLVGALPVRYRKVFLLRVLDGLSWVQIAEQLGFSVNTVKKYLCEANARINVMNRQR
jgi:RNA polymerase sigma factor (sigma-70 family)